MRNAYVYTNSGTDCCKKKTGIHCMLTVAFFATTRIKTETAFRRSRYSFNNLVNELQQS